ncbi:MAG: hypothetical protein HDR09_11035 [Lachnospiraceae bacterium]|nr:hypothetical protein [Lachnospiraceae bacterium]
MSKIERKADMKLLEEVSKRIGERLGDRYEVNIYQSTKTNSQKRDGIAIRKEHENVGVVIYPNVMEAEKVTLEDMVEEISKEYFRMKPECPEFHLDDMTKDQLLRRIILQAVSRERNVELLKNAPHKELLDIAIVYRFVLEQVIEGETLSFVITNTVAKKFDISLQELDMAAKQYAKQQNPYYITTMDSMINGLAEELNMEKSSFEYAENPIFVITNKRMIYGASVLAEPEVLGTLAHKLQTDLLVIPSSGNEVLAIPAAEDDDIDFFRYMVASANRQLNPEEILGTSVYRYRRDSGILEIA